MAITVAGTSITYNDSTTQQTAGYTGSRNRIINGAMAIDQRNNGSVQSVGSVSGSNSAYSIDQMIVQGSGSSSPAFTYVRSGTGPYSLSLATTNANLGGLGFGQRIEAANVADMAGLTATLSVDLSADSATTVSWNAWYANSKDTWTAVGGGAVSSSGGTQITTGSFSVTTTKTRFSASFTATNAANGLAISFVRTVNGIGQTLVASNLQLELGSVATPFEFRQIGEELTLCQRYLETLTAKFETSVASLPVTAYRAPKRTTPTLTTSVPSGTGGVFAWSSYNTPSNGQVYQSVAHSVATNGALIMSSVL